MIESGYADKIYPTTKLAPLIRAVPRTRLSLDQALRAAGLKADDIASPQTLVSIDQILSVYQSIVDQMRDPLLAYELGSAFHVTDYGMYGFAMLSSADYRRALEITLQYHQLSTPLVAVSLSTEAETAVWRFEPIPHQRMVGRLYEFVLRLHVGIFLALHHEITGERLSGLRLGLAFNPLPGEAAALERVGVAALDREPPGPSSLRFDSGLLQHPTRMGSAAVNQMLLQICDEQIEALRKREGVVGQVRTLLITSGCRVTNVAGAARRLGMTERSLRRRLAAEGASFRTVHDDVQLQTAISYLRDTELTVETIAELMGFSDAANFRRAFRRWTGRAPLQFRATGAGQRPPLKA
jgi:AraC-like DNA-binding protein